MPQQNSKWNRSSILKIYFTEVFADEKEQNSKHLYPPSKNIARRAKRNFRKTNLLPCKISKAKAG